MADGTKATPTVGSPVVRVLLKRRNGERFYALVDKADVDLVSAFTWHLDSNGYAARLTKDGYTERMARRILGLRPGDGLESDHISRDKLDNRRCNLRVATHAQNSQNRLRLDGNSKARGVSLRKGKKTKPYHAYGCIGGKNVHLGFYETEDEAAEVARVWRAEHMPFAID